MLFDCVLWQYCFKKFKMSEFNNVIGSVGSVHKQERAKESQWCKDWLMKRCEFSHINFISELRFAPKDWFHCLRMYEGTYLKICNWCAYEQSTWCVWLPPQL
jgi:hypothetical protein